jgi:signal transduction histidine kinase
MNMRNGARAPVRRAALFILMTGIPLAVLGIAGYRLLEHDRVQEAEQLEKQLENAAGVAARELDRSRSAWEARLTAAVQGDSSGIPPDTVVVVFDSRGIVAHHGDALPYYPRIAPRREAPGNIFAEAEAKEFREGNPAQASVLYRTLAETRDQHVRAAALMRLARCLSKQRQFDEALKAYAELAAMGGIPVSGDPAELIARRRRMALFETTGDLAAKSREATLLASALAEARYPIDRITFDSYSESLPQPSTARAQPLAAAVEGLWPDWQQRPAGGIAALAGTGASGGFVSVWQQTPAGAAAIVGSLDAMAAPAAAAIGDFDFRFALEDPAGRILWGSAFPAGVEVRRTRRESGLPWGLRISADNLTVRRASAARRNVLAAGLGLAALVITAAGYFVLRALTREFRVAQLQSDFVSAVSHEFRTPLTAMRHLTDLLEEGGVPDDGLSGCYSALGKETRRLHAMVESLLDFARLDSGRRTYDMSETNALELAGALVDEFREQRHLPAHRLKLLPPETQPRIRADEHALSLALRNLLDNAVKYSPESSTVSV